MLLSRSTQAGSCPLAPAPLPLPPGWGETETATPMSLHRSDFAHLICSKAFSNIALRVVAGHAGCYATPSEREQRCAGFCTFHVFRKSAAAWVLIGGRWGEDGGVINCFFWGDSMSARNCSASLQAQPLRNFWLLLQSLKRN